jgi:hypothetical protein
MNNSLGGKSGVDEGPGDKSAGYCGALKWRPSNKL